MIEINFDIKLKNKPSLSKHYIEKIINQSKKILKIKKDFEISVIIVGDTKIRSLNKKYRNKDQVTDVLSFSQIEGYKITRISKENQYLGDIFISYPQVVRQSKKFGHSDKKEFTILLIHGLLHLFGYDHEKDKDYNKMKQKEQEILNKIYD